MRPVGPESAETYWRRRAFVIGAALVVVIAVLIVMFNLGGSPGEAAPPTHRSTATAGTSVSPSPSPSRSPSISPSASPTPTPSASDQSGSPSTSPSPTSAATHGHKASGKRKPSADPSKTPSPSPTPVAACTSSQLTPVLKSKQHDVKAGSKVLFGVSYVNRSNQPCSVKINSADYELRITSGIDRIWSTADCTKLVRSTTTTLKPGEAAVWTMTWNGKRSVLGKTCQSAPQLPGAGYYHVTSILQGTQSVDYVLVLK